MLVWCTAGSLAGPEGKGYRPKYNSSQACVSLKEAFQPSDFWRSACVLSKSNALLQELYFVSKILQVQKDEGCAEPLVLHSSASCCCALGLLSATGRPGLHWGFVVVHVCTVTWADTVVTHRHRGRHKLLCALNAGLWDKSQLSAPAKWRGSWAPWHRKEGKNVPSTETLQAGEQGWWGSFLSPAGVRSPASDPYVIHHPDNSFDVFLQTGLDPPTLHCGELTSFLAFSTTAGILLVSGFGMCCWWR